MQNDMVVVLHADQFFNKVNPIERVHPDDPSNHIRNRFDDAKSHFKSGQYMDLPEIAFNRTPDSIRTIPSYSPQKSLCPLMAVE
jgi:hypothetical protein